VQTPFLETLEIDESALRHEIEFLIRCGVHGLVWPVAASEAHTIGYKERRTYAEVICRAANGRVPVVIGVTAPNQFEAMENTCHAQAIGASAIITLPSMDMSPSDPAMFAEYLSAIASSCCLPIFVQTTYPGRASTLNPHFLLDLASKVPSFRYVKEERFGAGSLPWRITEYVKHAARSEGSLTAMGGAGAMYLVNEMARGSGGTMPGAGFADIQVQIWNWFHAGRKAEARDLFSKMLMMAALEQCTGYVLQKEILRRRGIFNTVIMRSSRRPMMDQGDLIELDEIFEVVKPYFLV
jgi:4-hydroxy-tetrahydrodipicolinate synthase